MKPELIRILFVTSLVKGRRTNVWVKKIHDSWKLNGNILIFVELFLGDLDEKMTSAGYRRKRNEKESKTMRKPDNLFCLNEPQNKYVL